MSYTDSAAETYSKVLLKEKLGYLLWYPRPSEDTSTAHQQAGVHSRDIRNITGAGQFEFYFNVHEPKGCPSGF